MYVMLGCMYCEKNVIGIQRFTLVGLAVPPSRPHVPVKDLPPSNPISCVCINLHPDPAASAVQREKP